MGISEHYLPLAVDPATFMGALRIPKIRHLAPPFNNMPVHVDRVDDKMKTGRRKLGGFYLAVGRCGIEIISQNNRRIT